MSGNGKVRSPPSSEYRRARLSPAEQPAAVGVGARDDPRNERRVTSIDRVDAAQVRDRSFRYYDFTMAAFVVIILCSNLIGASKGATLGRIDLGPFGVQRAEFGAGILFFPVSYVLGDVLTEVYGYARARRVVWAGLGTSIFAAFMSWVVVKLPPAPDYHGQAALETVFGNTPRVFAASLAAFWVGEFANAVVLSRMKVWTGGARLWTRTIGSTVVGQAFDTAIFYPLAFYGVWTDDLLIHIMIANYLGKVGWEVLLTPVTYRMVGWLKRREGVDVFDRGTDLTPFTVRV